MSQPEGWTNGQVVQAIINVFDSGRLYPSQFVIENGKVYWATVDHNDAPSLEIEKIGSFIEDNLEILPDEWFTEDGEFAPPDKPEVLLNE